MQVVTNENIKQLITTGRVDEFKPPEAPKETAAAVVDATKTETPTRSADGKFVAKVDTPPADDVNNTHADATSAGDDDDLPERARQQIGKKHRAMKEAEEFGKAQYLERLAADKRAENAEAKLRDIEAKSRPVTVEEPKEPKPEDFATVALYTDALVDYKLAKKSAEQEVKAEKQQEVKAEKQRIADAKAQTEKAFGERIAAASKKYTDFEQVVSSLAGSDADNVHKDVIAYLQESEVGADLMYLLCKDRSELERLRKLSPSKAIAELGKLELKLEAPVAASTATASIAKTVSQAPAPITPIDASKSTVVQTDPSKMSFKELREYERQRESAARARR